MYKHHGHSSDLFKVVIVILIVHFTLFQIADCRECYDIDIRNRPSELNRLNGCTAILGFLQIVVIQRFPAKEFEKYVFPELREITGFVLIYRVNGLRSLGQLFPNLSIIRGNQLFQNYALTMFDVSDMKEIGLRCLQQISRGGVRIELCPSICDLDSIPWKQITSHGLNFFADNSEKCSKENLAHFRQKEYLNCDLSIEPLPHQNCHKSCILGCRNSTASGCFACKGMRQDDVCVEKCSETRIYDASMMRCITRELCKRLRRYVYEEKSQCMPTCPTGYTSMVLLNNVTDYDDQICRPCNGPCSKICGAREINYISEAQQLQGCTILNSSLHIRMSMKSDSPYLMKELTDYLGDIEEIYGYLKVFRSYSITSLEFLKKLKKVHGRNELENGQYAIIVYENNNLQALWDPSPEFTVLNGSIFLNFNSKLCPSVIEKFVKAIKMPNNESHVYVSSESNGNQQTCDVVLLDTNVVVLNQYEATLKWEMFRPKPDEKLIGFLINFVETTNTNVTQYHGMETCSNLLWRTRTVRLTDLQNDTVYHTYTLKDLNGMTSYAYFVRTEFEDNKFRQQGMTPITYFTTNLENLTQVINLRTYNKSSSTITLEWDIFPREVPYINLYFIDILLTPDDQVLTKRDFCLEPIEQMPELVYDRSVVIDMSCCCPDHPADSFVETGRDPIEFDMDPIVQRRKPRPNRQKRNIFDGLSRPPGFNISDIEQYPYYINTSLVTAAEIKNNQVEIGMLSPYTLYTFQFFACYNYNICSPYTLHMERTEPDVDLDVITLNFEQRVNYDKELLLHLHNQTEPNAAFVAYVIEIAHESDLNDIEKMCVTHLDYQTNQSFSIHNLKPGNVYFRAQAVSLARHGPFTEWYQLHVSGRSTVSAYRSFLLAILVIIGIFALGGFSIYLQKQRDCFVYNLARLRRSTAPAEDEQELMVFRGGVDMSEEASTSTISDSTLRFRDLFFDVPLKTDET